jgi:hypothetical protein
MLMFVAPLGPARSAVAHEPGAVLALRPRRRGTVLLIEPVF